MYIGLLLILMVVAFVTKGIKSRRVNLISILIIAPFLIFNRGNPDYYSYVEIFMSPETYAEGGYSFLIRVIKLFGGNSHEQVLLVLGIFLIVTLYRLTKYVEQTNLIIFLYALFPFVIDIIQIRNTFMILFVLNAVIEYINKKKIRCLIFLILGALFHNFGLVYIVAFFAINFIERNKYHKIMIVTGFLNFVLMPIIIKMVMMYIPIVRVGERLLIYLAETNKFKSLLSWGLILFLDLVIFGFVVKHKDIKENTQKRELIQLLYDLIYFGVAFFPCLLYLDESSRFFRNMFLFKYILLGCYIPSMTRDEKILFVFYMIVTAMLFSVLFHSDIINYNDILKQNIMFGS